MERLYSNLNPLLALGVRTYALTQETYFRVHGFPEFQYTNENLEAIVAGLNVQKDDRVLAICGSGDQPFAILEKAREVVAMDWDPTQLLYSKWRTNLLKLRRFERFLQIRQEDPFTTTARQDSRRRYFYQFEVLPRIRSNLANLSFLQRDLIDVSYKLKPHEFSKIYLSNAVCPNYSYPAFRKYGEFLGRLTGGLQEGGLIYLSNYDVIEKEAKKGGLTITNPSCLEVCEHLTLLAREKEKEAQSFWVPIVYRKVSTSV